MSASLGALTPDWAWMGSANVGYLRLVSLVRQRWYGVEVGVGTPIHVYVMYMYVDLYMHMSTHAQRHVCDYIYIHV